MKLQNKLRPSIAPRAYRERGVTLVELMIVVVILGLLTSIAFPAYQGYVERARRSDGKAMLTDVAARLERFYADNNTYTVTMTNLGFTGTSPSSGEGFYTAGVAAGPSGSIATSYTITVTPVAARWGGSGDGTCGALTLDSRGTQGSSAGSLSICWN